MNKTERQTSQTKLILQTAGKTAAILCVLLVLICALFLLLAPMRASDFLYSVGMKKFSAEMAYTAASRSDDFDDWWSVLVKSVSAQDHAKAYEAADRLEKHADYNGKIGQKQITVGGHTYSGKYYVAYNKARSGLISNPSQYVGIWNYCVNWVRTNGWGQYLETNFYSANPVKGFTSGMKDSGDSDEFLADMASRFDQLYLGEGDYADVTLSAGAKKDFAYTVLGLLNDKSNIVGADTVQTWSERAS